MQVDLSEWPAWSTWPVPGQPRLHSEMLSQKKLKNRKSTITKYFFVVAVFLLGVQPIS